MVEPNAKQQKVRVPIPLFMLRFFFYNLASFESKNIGDIGDIGDIIVITET
jgi:hypothetical protein